MTDPADPSWPAHVADIVHPGAWRVYPDCTRALPTDERVWWVVTRRGVAARWGRDVVALDHQPGEGIPETIRRVWAGWLAARS